MVALHLNTPCQLYFPTIITNKKTPRKTKNSHQGRTTENNCTTNEPTPKKVKLVKCNSEKWYQYVSGEIEISDSCTDENNNGKGMN